MTWFDSDGGLHLRPNPNLEQSENAPMYSGALICVRYDRGKLTLSEVMRFVDYCNKLYRPDEGLWYTTSVSKRKRFSHDNYTGVVTGLKCCIRWLEVHKDGGLDYQVYLSEAKWLLKRVPIFHKHPRDLIYLNFVRWPYLFTPLLFIPTIAMIVSCFQTHKVRGERKITKTDGKILTLMRCLAMPMPLTWLICNWLVKNKKRPFPLPSNNWHMVKKFQHPENTQKTPTWYWGDWLNVVYDYFNLSGEHPFVYEVAEWEFSDE